MIGSAATEIRRMEGYNSKRELHIYGACQRCGNVAGFERNFTPCPRAEAWWQTVKEEEGEHHSKHCRNIKIKNGGAHSTSSIIAPTMRMRASKTRETQPKCSPKPQQLMTMTARKGRCVEEELCHGELRTLTEHEGVE